MTRREKGMLSLVCLTGVASGVFMLWESFSAGLSTPMRTRATTVVLDEVGAKLNQITYDKSTSYVTVMARCPMKADPFRVLPKELVPRKAVPASDRGGGLQYTGFIDMSGASLAIIGGMEYRKGESVTGTPYVVKKIDSLRVTLFSETDGATLELPYIGNDL